MAGRRALFAEAGQKSLHSLRGPTLDDNRSRIRGYVGAFPAPEKNGLTFSGARDRDDA